MQTTRLIIHAGERGKGLDLGPTKLWKYFSHRNTFLHLINPMLCTLEFQLLFQMRVVELFQFMKMYSCIDLILPLNKLQKKMAAKIYYNLFSQMLFLLSSLTFVSKSILGMTAVRLIVSTHVCSLGQERGAVRFNMQQPQCSQGCSCSQSQGDSCGELNILYFLWCKNGLKVIYREYLM